MMKYRVLPHGGESISILGVGASSIQASTEKEIRETIAWAMENGINYFDLASAEAEPFEAYGQALEGIRGRKDLERILGFVEALQEERDYSVIGTFAPQDAEGVCVYCNHCAPCPAGLNIGLINKYYDLSKAGDTLAKNHYRNLEIGAGRCVQCGHCNSRCPFHVDQMGRMREIDTYFKEAKA